MSEIRLNARLELLRALAEQEDFTGKMLRELTEQNRNPEYLPLFAPLFVGEFQNPHEDVLLAAKEAAAIGDILYNDEGKHPNGPMVRITEKGYSWIRTHDVIAESAQEASNV